ncbi:MAG: tetratricopeptide repeat protein [Bryobacteraceae bacterium]
MQLKQSLLALAVGVGTLQAQQSLLTVHVADTLGRPKPNVTLATDGSGSVGPPTDVGGRTRIQLSSDTRPGTEIALQVIRAPADFVFLSPWNNRVIVPPFENTSQHFVEVILVQRGDRAALENGSVIRAYLQKINAANQPSSAHDRPSQADRDAVLHKIADQYGLTPQELDSALRDWGNRARDPFEKGLAALYAQDYPGATAALNASLRIRLDQLEKDQSAIADAATFLGQSEYEQGKFRESVAAYEQAVRFRADDGDLLNNLGLSVSQTGDYSRAEVLFRRGLLILEHTYGSTDLHIVPTLNNLASVLLAEGRTDEAAPFAQRGLSIRRAKLLPGDPKLANSLGNVGAILLAQHGCSAAESPLREAENIFRENPHPSLTGEGKPVPQQTGVDRGASNSMPVTLPRPMEQRAIVSSSVFASAQPGLASVLLNRASARACLHDLSSAEHLAAEAVQLQRVTFGPSHPETALGLVLLADILRQEGQIEAANLRLREALDIRENTLGPDHPATKEIRKSLDQQ